MKNSIATVLVGFFLLALTGCHFSAGVGGSSKQAAPDPMMPPIAGEWSEPVNGIRMMAKLVEQANTGPENMRALLIFTANVSDGPINVPPIRTEMVVHRQSNGNEPMEMQDTDNNFRIVAEDMNKQRLIHVHPRRYQELQSAQDIEEDLEPGEIRMHVVYLMLEHARLMQAMQQISRIDAVSSSALTWATHAGEPGEYRLHLTYQPDGYYEQQPDRVREIKSYKGWQDKQIVLPPVVVKLYEDDFRDEPIEEELNEF